MIYDKRAKPVPKLTEFWNRLADARIKAYSKLTSPVAGSIA